MKHSDQRTALIVGGGIGGLAAALALAQRNFRVELFEQAPQFSEVGAGIQLGPNSFRALRALGAGRAAHQLAVYPQALVMMDAVSGQQLARIATGAEFAERFAAPYAVIHRADLHRALLDQCQGDAAINLHTESRIIEINDDGAQVHALVENGARTRGDLLVGADGLWSAVREKIIGDGPPRRSGHIAYRAVLAVDQIPDHLRRQEMTLWAGPKCHLVHYPLRGGELFNLVAVFHSERYEEGWDAIGDGEELWNRFADTHDDVRAMLAKIDQWRMWVLCDREPIKNWSQGRVTLLGDAAHPMLQYLAQGAGMALEDAVMLAQCLDDVADIAAALQTYQNARYLRTGRAQLTARLFGEFYHAKGVRRELRNAFVQSMGADALAWLYAPPPDTWAPIGG